MELKLPNASGNSASAGPFNRTNMELKSRKQAFFAVGE